MSECSGCFNPIEECAGYGSCVPRLKGVIEELRKEVARLKTELERNRELTYEYIKAYEKLAFGGVITDLEASQEAGE